MDVENIEDLRLPQAVIGRLIKEALPAGVSVSKEAKTAIARSAAIFVLHATTYANEYAISHKRKNVTAEDVIHAIKVLECEELEAPLREAVEAFKSQRTQRQQQRKERKSVGNVQENANPEGDNRDAMSGIEDNDDDEMDEANDLRQQTDQNEEIVISDDDENDPPEN
ncbi:histone-like transcription factor (CBF/NF-Y) and archaeal histone domain-containing protein [Ditylenchus destructor]|uniref:DNA polymerase epsilon subunit 3 n=1 Tax=Ditylenchus destructor TaxID=166010 RepID=A0AAD4NBJ9_9BILA|nr:histone-like transcription factor (CBF/NF-Y) and archaeal histone domain-containing protein [Ditylenchus destructor]